MAECNTCVTKSNEKNPAGCKNNGSCGTESCNKLNVFDWLSDMDVVNGNKFNVVEIRFKNGRKDFFRNSSQLDLYTGDAVVVDVPNGHHIGYVSLQGELVRLQMKKKNVEDDENVRSIYRVATQRDMEKFEEVAQKEMPCLHQTRKIIIEQKLEMKLTDIEYQADGTKATFYYSAEDRVDFRELIKILAAEFKIRVEMRQISLRQEASRLGGIGICGRELCCSTWLTEFKSVSTTAARYQNLSLNPSKLSGQCGRLKCCLNYELDTYMEALQDIPEVEVPLQTQKGQAILQKTDIFKKILWFGYENENAWIPVEAKRVREIMELNQAGKTPASLQENEFESTSGTMQTLNKDLERMDNKFRKKDKKKKKNRRWPKNRKNQHGKK